MLHPSKKKVKPKPGVKPKTKMKAGNPKAPFSWAAKLITDAGEQKKYSKDPLAYLRSKNLTALDVIKASKKIKALVRKKNVSKNWW